MKKLNNSLDTFSEKRLRGRPARVLPAHLVGRARQNRSSLGRIWDRLWPRLSQAWTEQEVIDAFLENAQPYAQEFVPGLAKVIFRTLRERKFPKRQAAQINFLADSLAGLGWVTPRTARDICQKERLGEKRAHHILRYEYYVECSCSFEGISRDHGCPKCGAKIDFGLAPFARMF